MTTRAPLTVAEKAYLNTRRQAGASFATLALELGCSLETIRKWARCARTGQTPRPRGRPAHGILSTYPARVAEAAVVIKRTHPHWGPANVTLELQSQLNLRPDELPSAAQLSVLFKVECPEAVQPHQRQQYPERPVPPARAPHQRWQIDGKEKVPVGDHDVATILNIRDPAAALMIASQAIITTTDKAWRKVTLSEVQETFRAAFVEWGCPLEIQTDHEVVYTGAPGVDFPSGFTLWVVGLKMVHVTSRNHRPTDQAQVERNHRTLGDMTWKDEHFLDRETLQHALDARRTRYNTALPVKAADCQGCPPLVVHPEARHSGRPFRPEVEWDLFDLQRVDTYLAQPVWRRQITDTGNVSLGHHQYYVGRQYLNHPVTVRFITTTRTFCFELADGTLVNQLPAMGLDKADLIGARPTTPTAPTIFQFPLPWQGV